MIKEENFIVTLWENGLMHLTHNECKSVVAVRFIRTLKDLIYKKMAVIDSKSYLGYLSNLVDRYNNTYYPPFYW